MKKYAGVGSRKTPPDILGLMEAIALRLEADDYTLRSGGADGADSAFAIVDKKEIFTASDYRDELRSYIDKFHPTPERVSGYAEKLIGRNVLILLGSQLNEKVQFLICWTPGGKVVGGTGFTIKVARHLGIPVYNLYHSAVRDRFYRYIA